MALPDVSSCPASTEADQFQRRQRLEHVLAVTLPFKQRDVSQNIFALAIDQTQKRWAWFTNSRDLDGKLGTELGTLGYLPWEIRQQIFKAVLGDLRRDAELNIAGWFNRWGDWPASEMLSYIAQTFSSTGRAHDIFDLASYLRISQTIDYGPAEYLPYEASIPIPLRLSSPTLELEFDDVFLFNTIFKFESHARLQMFLHRLPDLHQTKLRRIFIKIWIPCGCGSPRLRIDWREGWKTACLQLPALLQEVGFGLNYSRPQTHARSCRRHGDSRALKEIKAAANLIEVLSKIIARRAPSAVVAMCESAKKELLPENLELFDAAVNDVER